MEDLRLAPVSFAMPNLAEVVSQLGVSGAEVLDLERFSGTPSAASLYAQLLTLNPAISSVAIATYQRGSGKTFCEEWERHIPLFGSVDWANCSVAEAVACLGRETGECRALSMTFEWNGEWVALPSVDFDTKAGVTVDFLKQIDQLCSELEVPAVVIHSGNGIHLVFLRQVYTDLELWKFSAKIMKRLSKISGIDCPWNNAVIEWVEQSGCLADFHDLSLDLWALAGKDDTTSVLREVVGIEPDQLCLEFWLYCAAASQVNNRVRKQMEENPRAVVLPPLQGVKSNRFLRLSPKPGAPDGSEPRVIGYCGEVPYEEAIRLSRLAGSCRAP